MGMGASTRAVASTFTNYKKNTGPYFKGNKDPQLRSSAQPTTACLDVSSKLITQSALSPLSSSDRNEASPSERFKRQLEKKERDVSREMTTRHTSLAAAIAVASQLDSVALHAVHLIAKATLPVDW